MTYCKISFGVKIMEYYEILKALREDNDLTQTQVANILGIKQASYSQYELNKRELPLHQLKKLCNFYKVSADYILGLPENLKFPKR